MQGTLKLHMSKKWTADEILELARGFQPACILAAAADFDLFDALSGKHLTASQVARRLQCDIREITILLDALVALKLLTKSGGRYAVPPSVAEVLTRDGNDSVLSMAQHQANCMRWWGQLAQVIKTGKPGKCSPSIRGQQHLLQPKGVVNSPTNVERGKNE